MKIRDMLDRFYLKASNLENVYIRKFLRYIVRTIANVYWKFICSFPIPNNLNKAEVIISLTTFPARINTVYLVCHSLLRQSVRPEKVILWLSKEQFRSINDLPPRLLLLQKHGLVIDFVDNDIKSHKKYYYVLQKYSNKLIILADDDIIYNSKLVETLILESKTYPNSIIAQYARKIKCDKNGKLMPYSLWSKTYLPNDNNMIFFGSGGGTLIPPYSLFKDVLNMDLFLKLTPTADDIWLNAMARLKQTPIYKSKLNSALITISSMNNITLSSINNNNQDDVVNNDTQLSRVNNYYQMNVFAR